MTKKIYLNTKKNIFYYQNRSVIWCFLFNLQYKLIF